MSAPADFPPQQPLDADIRRSLDEATGAQLPGDAELIARVKQRVFSSIGQERDDQHCTVRADGGCWEPVGPGVERKLLWRSGEAASFIVRLAPGAVVASHSHPIDEECVVLEGSLRIGADLLLRPGDFHVGVKGASHADASTETGAVVYLRTARAGPEQVR